MPLYYSPVVAILYFSWIPRKGETQYPVDFRENPGAWLARLCHYIMFQRGQLAIGIVSFFLGLVRLGWTIALFPWAREK